MAELDKKKRGPWIAAKIKEQGFSKTEVGDTLDISYSTVLRWLKTFNLDFPKMKMIADVIRIDLKNEYPEAAYLYQEEYFDKVNEDFKEKYLKLLQKHLELKEELELLKAKKK